MFTAQKSHNFREKEKERQMMKWGRKKPSSTSTASSSSSSASSSSHPHLISHVFPLSWLSKFKHSSDKPVSGISKNSQKGKQNCQKLNPKSPPKYCSPYRDTRFYTQDEDGFWQLSFGDGNIEDVINNNKSNSNSNSNLMVPQPCCGNCKSNVKEISTKNRSRKSTNKHGEVLPGKGIPSKEAATKDEGLQRTYRRIIEATSELQRELDEVKVGCRKSVKKEMPELELLQVMQMMGQSNQKLPSPESANEQRELSRESDSFHQQRHKVEDVGWEWQQMKEAKIKELLSKSEKQRRSFHISGGTQTRGPNPKHGKVRARTPRTPSKPETCRIKALENLKKAKMKKKMMKEMSLQEKAAQLESFAVVKCSNDPHQDFRESMIEMIIEKRIKRPEELEELLACYLTLNADEYHDLIIRVFRQVWCELAEAHFN